MIDRVDFAECFIPRAKTRTPQSARDPRRARPVRARVVGARRQARERPGVPGAPGQARGQAKSARNSYAKRLRAELFRAGVYRCRPSRAGDEAGKRKDSATRTRRETKLAPNPRDPLYFETATTLPVDFHSFRRAFNTALAEAGVNVQQAMHLAAHSDAKTHMRYVMRTAAMRAIPDAALPALRASTLLESSRPVTNHPRAAKKAQSIQHARTDSNRRPVASKATALSS